MDKTFLAGIGDLEFDLKSYIMGGTSCILMASYLTTLQYNGTVKQMSSIDLLYINSVNCIPLITLTSLGKWHLITLLHTFVRT